jgi:hypothetical protein
MGGHPPRLQSHFYGRWSVLDEARCMVAFADAEPGCDANIADDDVRLAVLAIDLKPRCGIVPFGDQGPAVGEDRRLPSGMLPRLTLIVVMSTDIDMLGVCCKAVKVNAHCTALRAENPLTGFRSNLLSKGAEGEPCFSKMWS